MFLGEITGHWYLQILHTTGRQIQVTNIIIAKQKLGISQKIPSTTNFRLSRSKTITAIKTLTSFG